MRFRPWLASLVLPLLFSSCAGEAGLPPAERAQEQDSAVKVAEKLAGVGRDSATEHQIRVKREEMKALGVQIREEVGTPTAATLAQCRYLPFGQKACGGPQSYLVYSTAQSDSARLLRLVRQYDEREGWLNEKEGSMSTCEVLPEPRLGLSEGRCVDLGPATPGDSLPSSPS